MTPCPTGTYVYTVKAGDTLWLIANHFHTSIQAIASVNPMLDRDNLYIGQMICIPGQYGYPEPVPYGDSCSSRKEQIRNGFMPKGEMQNGEMPGRQMPNGRMQQNQTLHDPMRLLWEQHVYWTRLVILSIVFGLPDEKYTTGRLLQNPKDFEALLRLYYGENIAAEFSNLFTSHLVIASELVKAAKAGDKAAADSAERQWYANADQIAVFLAGMNPYWTAGQWREMLYSHLAMTKEEAVSIMEQRYEDSIRIFDEIEKEALTMADTMTQGLMAQFP